MVSKMLTINTAHLSEKTLEMLNYEAVFEDAGAHKEKKFPFLKTYCVGHPNIGGVTYLIDSNRAETNKALAERELPDDLRRVLREAFVNWCDTIRLHDNGPIYANLPKYNCD